MLNSYLNALSNLHIWGKTNLKKQIYSGGTPARMHAHPLHAHTLPRTAARLLVGVARFISGSISQIAAPAARGACD